MNYLLKEQTGEMHWLCMAVKGTPYGLERVQENEEMYWNCKILVLVTIFSIKANNF